MLIASLSCAFVHAQTAETVPAKNLTWELGPTGSVASLRGLAAPATKRYGLVEVMPP